MHLEAHAMLGWAIGNLAGKEAGMRRYVTLAAVLPDLDGLGFFFGPHGYDRWHHTIGHNLFAWVTVAALAGWCFRSWKAAALAALAFGSHVIADMGLSGWPVYLLWPFSGRAFLFPHSVGLSHPLNIQLIYAGYAVVLLLALICRRTPLELFSPALDRLVMALVPPYRLVCGTCKRGANLACAVCGAPMCVRHTRMGKRWAALCPACAGANQAGSARPG
jgi:hypothetical protein